MTDRVPGAPGQYKAVITEAELQKMQAGEQFTITMTRDDQPITEGTPYSKAAVLPDALAAQLCPDIVDPAPAAAFQALNNRTKRYLLWQNENPYGALPAQTVSLGDLSAYKEYEVETRSHGTFRAKIGNYIHMSYNNLWQTGLRLHNRGITVTDSNADGIYDTLEIKDCDVVELTYANNAHVHRIDNSYVIVTAVYGIKGAE